MAKKTPAFLKKAISYVDYWVPRLRLDHYEIEVVEAEDEGTDFAMIDADLVYLHAIITVRDPKKLADSETHASKDLEVTIVHELVHGVFAGVCHALKGKAHIANECAT